MLYTSGTTGYPKGVAKPPDPDGYIAAAALYGYRDGNVHLCTGPLYHAAPFAIGLVPPLSWGVPVVMMERWDAEATLALIDEHRVTHMHLVPTMFHRLLSLPEEVRERYDVSSLLAIVHGAAPCPVPVKQAIIEWFGPIVHEYYSATEGYGTGVDSPTWLTKPGTVGRADPDHLYVGDPDGERLPAGEEGLVWIKATGVARFEYFGDDDKTGSAYRGDFFTLGDVGRVDEDGFLFLTDRSANLIISGGVNIYPAEIDAVLLTHPAVADVGTIGIPDDEWGETVLAVVEPKPDADRGTLPGELLAFCREHLAAFKCPRAVDLVDILPRDENGKLYKRRLRDEYRGRRPPRQEAICQVKPDTWPRPTYRPSTAPSAAGPTPRSTGWSPAPASTSAAAASTSASVRSSRTRRRRSAPGTTSTTRRSSPRWCASTRAAASSTTPSPRWWPGCASAPSPGPASARPSA